MGRNRLCHDEMKLVKQEKVGKLIEARKKEDNENVSVSIKVKYPHNRKWNNGRWHDTMMMMGIWETFWDIPICCNVRFLDELFDLCGLWYLTIWMFFVHTMSTFEHFFQLLWILKSSRPLALQTDEHVSDVIISLKVRDIVCREQISPDIWHHEHERRMMPTNGKSTWNSDSSIQYENQTNFQWKMLLAPFANFNQFGMIDFHSFFLFVTLKIDRSVVEFVNKWRIQWEKKFSKTISI